MGTRVEEDSGIDGASLRVLARGLRSLAPEGRWWPYDDPFEITVSAVLTQRARWEGAQRAMKHLRGARLLTPRALARAPRARVEACVRTAGFYRQKAAALQAIASRVVEGYGGRMDSLFKLGDAELRQEILSWRGVGEETADAILLYAARRPTFVVDAYTIRLMRRFGALQGDSKPSYAEVARAWRAAGGKTARDAAVLHAAIVDHSKGLCGAAPQCARCPIERDCARVL